MFNVFTIYVALILIVKKTGNYIINENTLPPPAGHFIYL